MIAPSFALVIHGTIPSPGTTIDSEPLWRNDGLVGGTVDDAATDDGGLHAGSRNLILGGGEQIGVENGDVSDPFSVSSKAA